MLRILTAGFAAVAVLSADMAFSQMAPANPTCPANPDWSNHREMRFTLREVNGKQVLLAEGQIDDDLVPRLRAALEAFQGEEIWLRSPGGNARIAKEAGILLRHSGLSTRIPSGWACYGACNFMFMGGVVRSVDPGGWFIVQLGILNFTEANGEPVSRELVNEVAEASALMATEDNEYLIRMGIRRSLLPEVMYRRSEDGSTRRCLTDDELRYYNLVPRVWRPSDSGRPSSTPD